MINKKYYEIYGLEIESEIKIKEFIKIKEIKENNKKVIFRYGITPKEVNEMHKQNLFVSLSKSEVYLYIEGVATYCISNGNEVIIDICKDADIDMVKFYILGSVLGILLVQRKEIAIHGATISKNKKAIILTGDRGAGKSTLTTALRLKGYNFSSDDVSAISYRNIPLIKHGFPYQKICEDMMEFTGYDKERYTSFKADEKTKYLVPDFDRFITEDVELNAICEITVGNVEKVEIVEVTGHDKLTRILDNIYKKEYISICGGMSKAYFKQCVDIAKRTKIYTITRPYKGYTVDEQIMLIEEKIIK